MCCNCSKFSGCSELVSKLGFHQCKPEVQWKPDRTHIKRCEFDEKLDALINTDAWIIDGVLVY